MCHPGLEENLGSQSGLQGKFLVKLYNHILTFAYVFSIKTMGNVFKYGIRALALFLFKYSHHALDLCSTSWTFVFSAVLYHFGAP